MIVMNLCCALLVAAGVFTSGVMSMYELADNTGSSVAAGRASSTQLGPRQCDRSQPEECCTAAVVGNFEYSQYTALSARGRHTAVNYTSAGLQYTMYFAVQGGWMDLLLSPASPRDIRDLFYQIKFSDYKGGHIYLWENPPHDVLRQVQDVVTYNIISPERYTYYYLSISGETLKVGRRGEPPLLTHSSAGVKRLQYFSFKRWYNMDGAALYDCAA